MRLLDHRGNRYDLLVLVRLILGALAPQLQRPLGEPHHEGVVALVVGMRLVLGQHVRRVELALDLPVGCANSSGYMGRANSSGPVGRTNSSRGTH